MRNEHSAAEKIKEIKTDNINSFFNITYLHIDNFYKLNLSISAPA